MDTTTLNNRNASNQQFQLMTRSTATMERSQLGVKPDGVMVLPPSEDHLNSNEHKALWYVRLRNGFKTGVELAVRLHGPVVIGAKIDDYTPDLDLSQWGGYERGVSRRHLLLRPTENSLFAIDLSSSNGSYFNGLPMSPDRAYRLGSGDLLSLGNLHLTTAGVGRTAEEVGGIDPRKLTEEAPPATVRPFGMAVLQALRKLSGE